MFKRKILYFFLILIIILSAITLYFYSPTSKVYAEINGHRFFIEVADTPAKQAQGYSDHQPINDNEGMLFVFSESAPKTFWMKNMLFPLDIIWIHNDKIVNISRNLPPEGEVPSLTYSSGQPVNFVLEIKAGLSDKFGFKTGDIVKFNLNK